jgi:Ca-activated chloride channel family protein
MWREPGWLWLLLLVPLVAWFLVHAFRRRKAALEAFAEARLLDRIAPGHDSPRRRASAAALVAALAFGLVALAGPKWGFHWEEVRREGIDLMIAIDTSRSMLASDVRPNRLERAKLAVQDLIRQLEGDRVGLIAFAGSAFVQCPLTHDYQAFGESLRAIDVGIIPRGGTSIGEAVRSGVAAFEGREGRHAALVVITDGENHDGDIGAAAQEALAAGIRVYTVGIGTREGELIEVEVDGRRTFLKDRQGQVVKSRLDEETLRTLATTTGGAYLYAQGPSLGLDELYDDYIAKMEKREIETSMKRRFQERFQIPLLLAFLLLAAEPVFRTGRRRSSSPWPWRRRA